MDKPLLERCKSEPVPDPDPEEQDQPVLARVTTASRRSLTMDLATEEQVLKDYIDVDKQNQGWMGFFRWLTHISQTYALLVVAEIAFAWSVGFGVSSFLGEAQGMVDPTMSHVWFGLLAFILPILYIVPLLLLYSALKAVRGQFSSVAFARVRAGMLIAEVRTTEAWDRYHEVVAEESDGEVQDLAFKREPSLNQPGHEFKKKYGKRTIMEVRESTAKKVDCWFSHSTFWTFCSIGPLYVVFQWISSFFNSGKEMTLFDTITSLYGGSVIGGSIWAIITILWNCIYADMMIGFRTSRCRCPKFSEFSQDWFSDIAYSRRRHPVDVLQAFILRYNIQPGAWKLSQKGCQESMNKWLKILITESTHYQTPESASDVVPLSRQSTNLLMRIKGFRVLKTDLGVAVLVLGIFVLYMFFFLAHWQALLLVLILAVLPCVVFFLCLTHYPEWFSCIPLLPNLSGFSLGALLLEITLLIVFLVTGIVNTHSWWLLLSLFLSAGFIVAVITSGKDFCYHTFRAPGFLIFLFTLFMIIFAMVLAGSHTQALFAAHTKELLPANASTSWSFPDTAGHPYPSCSMRWGANKELSVVDLAILSNYAYANKTKSEWSDLSKTFNYDDTTAEVLDIDRKDKVGRVVVTRFSSKNGTKNTTVLAVKGSDQPFDFYADMQMWAIVASFQIFVPFFDILDLLPNSFIAWIITGVHSSEPALEGVNKMYHKWHDRNKDDEFIVTGHSLGGGIAIATGGHLDLPAVAFSGPGDHFSRHLFGSSIEKTYRNAVDIKPTNDPVHMFDRHDDVGQYIACTASGLMECHSIVRTICELWRVCGYERQRDFEPLCKPKFGSLPQRGYLFPEED